MHMSLWSLWGASVTCVCLFAVAKTATLLWFHRCIAFSQIHHAVTGFHFVLLLSWCISPNRMPSFGGANGFRLRDSVLIRKTTVCVENASSVLTIHPLACLYWEGKTTKGLSLRLLFASNGKPEVNSEFFYMFCKVGTLVTGDRGVMQWF